MTDRAVADHPTDIDALGKRVDRREIVAVGLPVPREPFEDGVGGNVLDRLHQLREPAFLTLAHGREGDTAVAEHDRGHPVPAR